MIASLEHDIAHNAVAHAYLFSGSADSAALAKKFAMQLQCNERGCSSCRICNQIMQDGFQDLKIFYNNNERLKIKDVRKIQDYVSLSTTSNYKIVILEHVERMTREAANAFLKTLEEPPAQSIFILTTNNFRSLLPTIVSRTRVIRLQAEQTDMREHALWQPLTAELRAKALGPLFARIESVHKDAEQVREWILVCTHILRASLIEDENRPLEWDRMHLAKLLEELTAAENLQKNNINAKLLLEHFCLQL